MFEVWVPLVGGLVLLIAGGELLVRGAVQVATRFGVSPLVIGLTLVGFGTSTPELVTSVQAALAGAPGIAYGNVVGSNIANVLLIGGVAALLFPIAVQSSTLKRDGAVMVAVALVFALLAAAMPLGRAVGAAFVVALVVYIYTAFRQERTATVDHGAAYEKGAALQDADPGTRPRASGSALVAAGIAIGGLVLVVLGGRFLVDGAVALARGFGISETVIGLTIVAVGTSMPELVTSVVAGLKRQGDVAFGNIVGSNIYNLLGIAGATMLMAPGPVPAEIVSFDNLVMVGVSVLLVGFAWTGLRIARWEGAVLLAGYGLYVWSIWP
ncbi:calcium/sodium antiporter [Wenxinia marina]|uniref:Wenxma_17, whole genome shotgun sequence n=1 Tax=Wenxinia marina DSM 24838 TaxID=1123501 RepID=A0A0D0QAB0_9RHOB|nr:calcium/sodium antiporter [Wenxinia marina]KIQ67938.1 K+-dependent Na+/Ca+ exchanger related-protein [Wenxinia marina DSM 24838]GGL76067.1 sodium:calcium antiporter [Wenxinia marina]